MDEDLAACADLVRRGDPDRFLAAMAAPVRAREVLFPIYAFNVEVARAPWVTQEAMIAEMRLQWWRDVLAEIGAGGPVRRHEVATPLARVLDAQAAARLDALVEARRWDIYRDPFEDMAHFRDHIARTSGALVVSAALALAAAPEAPLRQAGYALGLANWLRAVPRLERAGRIPLVAGTPEAVRALAQEGLQALAAARRAGLPGKVRPALMQMRQAAMVLRRAARAPGRVAAGRLEPAPARTRLALMATVLSGRW